MIRLADDTRIFIAIGHTDMRKGFDGLAIWYRRLEQGTYQLSHAGPSDNGMEVRCECCGEIWCEIGGESSEQLEFIPAQWKVIQHDRVKYACQSCQEHVTLAPKPPQPIEKGLPGPGLAAHTTLSKTGDHTPLYRQEDIHSRIGWTVRRSTLCGWWFDLAWLSLPLVMRMQHFLLQSQVLHTDDTKIYWTAPLLVSVMA